MVQINFFPSIKKKFLSVVIIILMVLFVPILDAYRFQRENYDVFWNLWRRVWDNLEGMRLYLENYEFMKRTIPNSIYILLYSFLPRNLFPHKPYPFETQVAEKILYKETLDYKWKADIGGIIEFFHDWGIGGVIVCGFYNALMFYWFSIFLEKTFREKNVDRFTLSIIFISVYGFFNVGLSAKLFDMFWGFLFSGFIPYFVIRILKSILIGRI